MTIQWGYHFITGISEIDGQHRTLVALANDLEATVNAGADILIIEDAFQSLAGYTRVHFALEEKLMDEAGVDAEHVHTHRLAHASFVGDLMRMWHLKGDDAGNSPKRLLEFLTTWIYRHILITDRDMARIYHTKKGLIMPPSLLAA